MKAKQFYLNLEHVGLVKQGFNIKLFDTQTILSVDVALMKRIHVTLHQPQADKGLPETVSHVRESMNDATVTLLRVPREKRLVELGGVYVDRNQLDTAKEFKKSAYHSQYVLPENFGDYLTFRFFQGPADLISKTMEELIATRKPGVIIPHEDGFYIDPSGREETNEVKSAQIIFDQNLNPTIAVLALGVDKSFEVVGNDIAASQSLKFVALAAHDKRYIRR